MDKKTSFPKVAADKVIVPRKIRAQIFISKSNDDNEFAFVKDIISKENIPWFNGDNTNLCQQSGHSRSHRNQCISFLLISHLQITLQ